MVALPVAMLEERSAALRRPSGAFAMLALDQRVSLATMFRAAGAADNEASMDAFRSVAAKVLSPCASAILLERGFVGRAGTPPPWSSGPGLILAADDLVQPTGRPAQDSHLDRTAVDIARDLGAVALKLLVVWHEAEDPADHVELVRTFVSAAHGQDLLAVVECITHGPREAAPRQASAAALLRAAEALSAGADLYKAQVPIHGGSNPADVERLSAELTAASACPWVVLSTGVPPERFEEMLVACCRGGASGFLAGRAVWASAIGMRDPARHLREHALPHLERLISAVDAEATPWPDALRRKESGARA